MSRRLRSLVEYGELYLVYRKSEPKAISLWSLSWSREGPHRNLAGGGGGVAGSLNTLLHIH